MRRERTAVEYASADLYADDFLYDLKKGSIELTNLIHDHAYDSVRLKMREKCSHGSKKRSIRGQ